MTLRAVRLSAPLTIDGRLDEEVYQRVPPTTDFVQQDPQPHQPATEQTEVWVFFDGANVYASGRCRDSHPELMVANDMRRDGNVTQNENVIVTFDTFHDKRTGFFFQTSPVGAMRDGLITDQRNFNMDWNGVWNVKVARDERGWSFEMVIPFKTLRYPMDGIQTWGMNVRRTVRWKNETSFLSFVSQAFGNRGVFVMASSATLVQLEAPMSSRNMEIKPYIRGGLVTDARADPPLTNDPSREAGVDLKYGLTRGLISDVTINTDFAQTEADDVQVNLTRASLFFPERREFFLEGQGVFTFANASGGGGGSGQNQGGGSLMDSGNANALTPVMFFSRRIGLDAGGEVPIVAGGRMAGRAGHYGIGVLNIVTGERSATRTSAAVESTNFSVVRVRRDLLRRSQIGFIGTNRSRQTGVGGSNQLYGADMLLNLSDSLSITSYVSRSQTRDRTMGQTSYLGRFDYSSDRYGLNFERLAVGEHFTPEVGFVPRAAFKRGYGYARFSPRLRANKTLRKLSWQSNLDYITDPNGVLQSREAQTSFRVDWNNGDQWQTEFSRNFERLQAPGTFGGARVAVGDYDFGEIRTMYAFGPSRFFVGRAEFSRGGYYDGTRTIAAVNGRLNTGARLGIEPRVSFNWIDVRSGKVTAKIVSGRTTLTMTPRMFVVGLIQYDSASASLSSNIRFRWEYIPGSDFFVIYSDGRDTRPDGYATLDNRTFVMKFTRMIRW